MKAKTPPARPPKPARRAAPAKGTPAPKSTTPGKGAAAPRRAAPALPGTREITLSESRAGAFSPEHEGLVAALLDWFARNRRPLPWRVRYDPYEVLVSEIMLQQTQMERAAAYFTRWMERFPTLGSVAAAHEDEVLKAWEGLGYYSRAKNLHKAARDIMARHGGRIPEDMAALRALPGIGEYTAGAVLSIACNKPYVAVDANVERVFSRLFDVGAPVKSAVSAGFIRDMAETLLPAGQARDFNQALMELGALVCRKKPDCDSCPVQNYCQARHLGIVHERPVPGRKVSYSALEIVTGVLMVKGRLFVQKRLDTGVWAGFWEFPGGRREEGESPEEGIVREFLEETGLPVRVASALGIVRHAYTRYRIVMHCFVMELCPSADTRFDSAGFPVPELTAATESRWVLVEDLDAFTLPAGHRKLVDAWGMDLANAARQLAAHAGDGRS